MLIKAELTRIFLKKYSVELNIRNPLNFMSNK